MIYIYNLYRLVYHWGVLYTPLLAMLLSCGSLLPCVLLPFLLRQSLIFKLMDFSFTCTHLSSSYLWRRFDAIQFPYILVFMQCIHAKVFDPIAQGFAL